MRNGHGEPHISLALVFHNHQPVGNFGWVIEEVWERSYEPMIAALERHPKVRAGLHYTGPLLEWMAEERPDGIERIQALVSRGQAEILGGGHFEPILVSLPQGDRHGQLVRMADEVERLFGGRPRGAWLAERVWEPSLPADLADAGYAYTVLDDNHLRGATVPEDRMWGTYTTDDQGRSVTIFGTEQGLRYRIPWVPVPELIDYLRKNATAVGRRLGTMGDDGEKFGAWPGTHEYCWGAGRWVEHCFTALEDNADWLSTVTPSGWLERERPVGRIYVPTSSYVEMTQWALPPDEANLFHDLLEVARETDDPAARFLRGAMWRNFQARYREINDLHKQMLRVSRKVAAMPAGPERESAVDHLYRGQSNDCYWHGLFGGVYIVHMRMATLAHLIAAEDIADGGVPRTSVDDHDLDGVDEVLLGGPGQSVLIDLDEGAGIGAWDLLASRVALAASLRRRPEAYHQQLLDAADPASATAAEAVAAAAVAPTTADETVAAAALAPTTADETVAAPVSPHAAVLAKEEGLVELLRYDPYERRSSLVHLFPPPVAGRDIGPAELAALEFEELGDFVDGPFQLVDLVGRELTVRRDGSLRTSAAVAPLRVTKRLALDGDRLGPSLQATISVRNGGEGAVRAELDVEWDLNLMGGGANPAAYYLVPDPDAPDGEPRRSPHDGTGDLAEVGDPGIRFGNEHEGVDIALTVAPAARLMWYPIETVSNSEAGFERIYQASSLHVRWPLALQPGEEASFACHFAVTQTRDRRAEEADGDESARGAADPSARGAVPLTLDAPSGATPR